MTTTAVNLDRYDLTLDDRVPVTVLTGFLGSGKTTLLNRILGELPGERIAVIENEFDEIGIDHALLLDAEEEIFETDNGRVCCTVRGDLVRILTALVHRREHFDRILVETTGLAHPMPVARSFFLDEQIRERLRLDAIVTMIDAGHAPDHLPRTGVVGVDEETVAQVAFADRIVINKTDLVTPVGLCDLSTRIRAINAVAPIVTAEQAQVDLDFVLGVEAFDLSRALYVDPEFLTRSDHRHNESVASVGIDLAGELDPDRVERWLRDLLAERGRDIFRSKGVLALADHQSSWVFQGVHTRLETDRGQPWAPGEPRRSRMVFIGRNLDRDALEGGLRSCLAGA